MQPNLDTANIIDEHDIPVVGTNDPIPDFKKSKVIQIENNPFFQVICGLLLLMFT